MNKPNLLYLIPKEIFGQQSHHLRVNSIIEAVDGVRCAGTVLQLVSIHCTEATLMFFCYRNLKI